MSISKERVREAIDNFYSKEILYSLYTKYFLEWIADGYIGSNLGLFEVSLITINSNKQTFLDLIEQFYLKKEAFCSAFVNFSDDVKEVFEEVVWNRKKYILPTEKEKYFNMEKTYDLNKDLKDEFLFFKVGKDKDGEYLFLEYDILRGLREYLPKPKDYNIYPAGNIETKYIDNNENEIIENIKLYFNFYSQEGIKLSNSGKILKDTKINMKKYCNIREYYNNSKDLDFLKTETIALFFFLIDKKFLEKEYFVPTNIKNMIKQLMSGELIKEEDYQYTSLYLNYLKGTRNIWKSKEEIKRGIKTIRDIISEIPNDAVVSMENLINAILYRDRFIEIIDIKDAYDYIYINEANYERTKLSGYEDYLNYVIVPFIKSVFFLLSVLGVFEIYYDLPSTSNALFLKNGYFNKYDGIKYIKFTEFGKYVFDRVENYDFKNLKEDGEVILDEERLIATLIGESPVKAMYLERVAQKISSNIYKFSQSIFTRGAKDSMMIRERIEEFYSKIDKEPKGIWKDFLDEILRKSEAIKIESELIVLKLSNDKELLKVVSADEKLKKMALKGEEYHLLIKREDFLEVTRIFKEYGYHLDI